MYTSLFAIGDVFIVIFQLLLGNKVETLNGNGSKTVKEYLHFLYENIVNQA